jgi:AraC-like DNA-binding protein
MHIVVNRLRPAVRAAIETAVFGLPLRSPLLPQITRSTTTHDFRTTFAAAQVVVLDLEHESLPNVTQIATTGLQEHPHVAVVVIPVPLTAADDQRALFTLGRHGVRDLPSTTHATTSAYWVTLLDTCADQHVLRQFRVQLLQLFGDDARGQFIRDVADGCTAPTVATLSDRLYTGESLSVGAKRRRLWKACTHHDLPHPEMVWSGCRLLLLKYLLDDNRWSLTRIATYFGYDSARHLTAMCNRRYAMTPSALKACPRLEILVHVVTLFNNHAAK